MLLYMSLCTGCASNQEITACACNVCTLVFLDRLTHDQVPDPYSENPFHDIDTLRAARGGPYYSVHPGGSDLQMGQGGPTYYSDYCPPLPIQGSWGDSGPSDPQERTADTLSSELYPRFTVGRVEGAAQDPVATQGQHATTGIAPSLREGKVAKKVRDRERKRIDRSNNARDNARICELLNISMTPKNTLSNRSECWCIIHPRRKY
jgi:hypothetical protein